MLKTLVFYVGFCAILAVVQAFFKHQQGTKTYAILKTLVFHVGFCAILAVVQAFFKHQQETKTPISSQSSPQKRKNRLVQDFSLGLFFPKVSDFLPEGQLLRTTTQKQR